MEPQARAPRVLCAAAQPAATDDAAHTPADSTAAGGAPGLESGLGARLHDRHTLYDGRRIRVLNVLDEGNREGLEIAIGPSLPSRRVTRVLDELVAVYGRLSAVRVDNGPEFTAQVFVDWCTDHGIAMHYIQPGKPDQNAYIERFNRSYRTEVLNAHLFESIAELRALTSQWLEIYNRERPHDSLGPVPPLTFLPRPSSAAQSPLEGSA